MAQSRHTPNRAPGGVPSHRVIVAVLTYRRPDPLRTCIDALQRLERPAGTEVSILVIDNDPDGSAIAAGEDWQARSTRHPLQVLHEPRRGIPAARNCALDAALASPADLLCFLDDDEFPDATWLAALLKCRAETGAELIGGPVFVADAPTSATWWQGFINASLQARARRTMARTARRFRSGGRYTVVTNNWMCDLAWLDQAGLRFDEDLEFSGGSDTVFYHAARQLGCKTAWCPDAHVREQQPPARLSLAYQFRRAYSQSINHYRFKHLNKSALHRFGAALHAALRLMSGTLLFVVPIYGVASPVIAARSMGWAFGRWRAMTGGESQLYRT